MRTVPPTAAGVVSVVNSCSNPKNISIDVYSAQFSMTQTIITGTSLSQSDSSILQSTLGCAMYGSYTPKLPSVSVLAISPTTSTSVSSLGKSQIVSQVTYLVTYYYVGYGNATLYQSKLVNQVSEDINNGVYNGILDSYVKASGQPSPLSSASTSADLQYTPPQIMSASPSSQPISQPKSSSSSSSGTSAGASAGIAIGVIVTVFLSVALFIYYRANMSNDDSTYEQEEGGQEGGADEVIKKGSITSKVDFNYPTNNQNGVNEGIYFDNAQYIEKAAQYALSAVVEMSDTVLNKDNNGMTIDGQNNDVNYKIYEKSNEDQLNTFDQENPMQAVSLGAFLDGDNGGVDVVSSPKIEGFRTSLAAFFD